MQPPCLPAIDFSAAQAADMERAFAALTTALGRHSSLDVRATSDFTAPMSPGVQRVSVRCDVAGDPAWMLPLARHAARYALPSTFFFCHREDYFATQGWLPPFLVAGPEIGLKVIPWRQGDPSFLEAGTAIIAAAVRLRDQGATLSGLAFDPPCHGVAAEAYEIFNGWSLDGRNHVRMGDMDIPLQTLDMATLGIRFTTIFGQKMQIKAAAAATYFTLAGGSAYDSTVLRHSYWSQNPLWNLHGFTTLTYAGNGAWLRYDSGNVNPPEAHWNVTALVDWIAATGSERHYQFVFDPRLIAP